MHLLFHFYFVVIHIMDTGEMEIIRLRGVKLMKAAEGVVTGETFIG
jgi:hypothetical protein